MRTIFALTLSLFSLSVHAAPVVLTFEDAVVRGSPGPETISYRGYSLSSEEAFATPTISPDPALLFCPGCSVTVREENDNPFSLSSFDFISAGGTPTFTLTGGYAGGGTITEEFFFTAGTWDSNWENTVLGSGWTNLEYVVFDVYIDDGFVSGLDNVALNAVPVPAAVWLFGSALAGLGWMRRRV
jgi:hypothetical protein